jgi:membrane fusion protein, multidrug efflux system
MKPELNKSRLKVYIPLAAVVVLVLAGCWYWYRDYTSYITSDDAHVDAENVSIGSKMLGRIAAVYADEGDQVKAGALLAVLDSTDLVAQRNQAKALWTQSLANLSQTEVKYDSDQKGIRVLEINLERASDDLDRAKKQSEGGVITAEQFSHTKKGYETAVAQLDAAKTQLLVSKSMINSAKAAAETSEAQVRVLDTQLNNTRLYSPDDGVISKRWLLPGDVAQPGQAVFTLTKSKSLWVVAFLEETSMYEIHVGQKVKFTIDAFPSVRFEGKVFLVGSTTASVFSLIPANNASGNFTKVTQRVPVRISIESADSGNDLSSYNILSGMSVVVKIYRN